VVEKKLTTLFSVACSTDHARYLRYGIASSHALTHPQNVVFERVEKMQQQQKTEKLKSVVRCVAIFLTFWRL
jgi:hypothetical protein